LAGLPIRQPGGGRCFVTDVCADGFDELGHLGAFADEPQPVVDRPLLRVDAERRLVRIRHPTPEQLGISDESVEPGADLRFQPQPAPHPDETMMTGLAVGTRRPWRSRLLYGTVKALGGTV
jgi:hypothetical protein